MKLFVDMILLARCFGLIALFEYLLNAYVADLGVETCRHGVPRS